MDIKQEGTNDFQNLLEQNYTKLIENESLTEVRVKSESRAARARKKSVDEAIKVEKRQKRKGSNEGANIKRGRGRPRLSCQQVKKSLKTVKNVKSSLTRNDLENYISSELAKFNEGAETTPKKESRRHACGCGKSFKTAKTLEAHTRIHTGERPYFCDVCEKTFTQSSHLTQHYRTHTGEKPYICSECLKPFAKSSHLSRHMQIHMGLRPFKCDVCGKSFIEMAILKRHYMIHTGEKPFACGYCVKAFNQLTSLKLHMRNNHPNMPLKREAIQVPKKEQQFFDTIEELKAKITAENNLKRLQQKKLLTRDDLESFISSELSKLNAAASVEEEPEIIGEEVTIQDVVDIKKLASKRIRGRKRGLKTTRKEKYQCNECERSFKFFSQLKVHENMHTGERPYACGECSKRFKKNSHLHRHLKLHRGEKEFACSYCAKRFVELSMLKRHEMIHTGEKPYPCEICDKSFNQLQALNMHYRVHIRNQYACTVCALSFRTMKTLRQHNMDQHAYESDSS